VNGDAMTYELWYNKLHININNNATMNETFVHKLEGLEAFTNYTITVVACTSFCSEMNENLRVTTSVGRPSMMLQPRMESLHGGKTRISWDAPKVVGGKLDFFELRATKRTGESSIYRISGRARSCEFQNIRCDNVKIDFAIRGVNVDKQAEKVREVADCFEFPDSTDEPTTGHFYGEYSETMTFYCDIHFSMVTGAIIFVLLLALLTFIYLFIRLYQKYKHMKDIHIIWPKGLDPDSLNSSPSKKESSLEAIKDLDLIKDHVLTDIDEDEEKEKFLDKDRLVVVSEKSSQQRESGRSEIFLPFICNPKTNEVFYTMPKMSSEVAPSSPTTQPTASSDYTKMYAPVESPLHSPVEGYLDMTGKSPTTPSTPVKQPEYIDNNVKMFIKDSQMHNNGYIGKRASVVTDGKKPATIINANGYVGLQK
jgi:hypothetical protein